MRHLPLAVAAACVAAAASAAVLAPAAAFADTTASAAGVINTKIANVHVRTLPKSTTGSKLAGTIAAAGTPVSAVCYTVTSDHKTWYKIAQPSAGWVAGRNLAVPHTRGAGHTAAGVPACTS